MPQDIKTNNSNSMAEMSSEGTVLSSDVVVHRKIRELESSDLYKNAEPRKKIDIQKQFYSRYIATDPDLQSKISLFDWTRGRVLREKQTKENFENWDNKPIAGIPLSDPIFTSKKEKYLGGIAEGGLDIANVVYHGLQALTNPAVQGVSMPKDYKHQAPKNETFEKFVSYEQKEIGAHYDDSLRDTVLRDTGKMTAQLPIFEATGGILNKFGLDFLINPEVMKNAGFLGKLGGKVLYNAADGYLVGHATGDDPKETAKNFAIGTVVFTPAEKLIGKLAAIGGNKLIDKFAKEGINAIEKGDAPAKVSTLTTAIAGTEKQKIRAATVKMLNEMVGGDWSKSSAAQKRSAIDKLAKIAPEIKNELAAVNKSLVEASATINITKQRQAVPEYNDILNKLEQLDKTPTAKSVADSVSDKAQLRMMKKRPGSIVPGAASITSPEFEENFTKAVDIQLAKWGVGKNNLVFEDRGHKELFYLNTLMDENRVLGASKERNKTFNILLKHLGDRYPGTTLPDLVRMSDNVWNKVNNLVKTGHADSGTLRLWRQSEFRPGQSPFGHEVELLREAAKVDNIRDLEQLNELEGRANNIEDIKATKDQIKNLEIKIENAVDKYKNMERLSEAKNKLEALEKGEKYTPFKASVEGSGKIAESVKKKETAVTSENQAKKETSALQQAMKDLYPDKTFDQLTGEERIKVVNKSLGK